MGNVYRDARDKLSQTQKTAMDNEYQDMKSKGKLAFTSKITGLDYTIPGNAKKTTTPADVSSGKDFMDRVMGISQPKPVDIRTDKGVPAPEPTQIGVPERVTPQIAQDNTAVATPKQERLASDLDKATNAYNKGRSATELDALNKIKATSRPNLSPKGEADPADDLIAQKAKAMDKSTYMQIPEAISGLAKKVVLNKNLKNDDSYDQYSKAIIYKASENAETRAKQEATEKNKPFDANSYGIDYKDYKGLGTKEDDAALDSLQKGTIGLFGVTTKAFGSKVLDVAASLGGANVQKGKDGSKNISDTYDFVSDRTSNKDGSLKENYMSNGKNWKEHAKAYWDDPSNAAYRDIRRTLAKKDAKMSRSELEKFFKTSINLKPSDTTGFAAKRRSFEDQ